MNVLDWVARALQVLAETAPMLFVVVVLIIAVGWVFLHPRSRGKAPILVFGWVHDDCKSEPERLRRFYEQALVDRDKQVETRITEWRGFTERAQAFAAEASSDRKDLLEAVVSGNQDIRLLLELQRARLSGQPPAE